MNYPKKRITTEVESINLFNDQVLPIYAGSGGDCIQIEVMVRKDGAVGVFVDEHVAVLKLAQQECWLAGCNE
jgi:16S rRNA G966 N2-methylase RsmD